MAYDVQIKSLSSGTEFQQIPLTTCNFKLTTIKHVYALQVLLNQSCIVAENRVNCW